eukprot:TRINITY_DN29150_c0_g1_i1.p1 TRINITY_DN29150_c0_g1~~TRINITY_DN29150_c0_g1_i1.p1  ORF type:complete len:130 (-),score=38.08 TRINITY_DN29150_c0_g1_i1:432-788(-)
MSQLFSFTRSFPSLVRVCQNLTTKLVKDREHAGAMAAIATFSAMSALTFHLQAEKTAQYADCVEDCGCCCSLSKAEIEVRARERSRALVMTVDFNNFLPCLSVSESATGSARIEYKPV